MSVADEERLPDWERELLKNQAAEESRAAALRAGRAVLDAYERGALNTFAGRYLAETLRMVLDATDRAEDDT